LTDQQLPRVECLPLRRQNKGWWAKLELFRIPGPVAYFDLDTIIIDDITDIIIYPHVFTALTGFKPGRFASGFMAWNGDFRYLDQDIDDATQRVYSATAKRWGDQDWIREHLRTEPALTETLFPGRFVSYKLDVLRSGRVPPGASVVCFHGTPRPHQVNWSLL
jgi:hypothetical protein